MDWTTFGPQGAQSGWRSIPQDDWIALCRKWREVATCVSEQKPATVDEMSIKFLVQGGLQLAFEMEGHQMDSTEFRQLMEMITELPTMKNEQAAQFRSRLRFFASKVGSLEDRLWHVRGSATTFQVSTGAIRSSDSLSVPIPQPEESTSRKTFGCEPEDPGGTPSGAAEWAPGGPSRDRGPGHRIRLDPENHTVTFDGEAIALTPMRFAALARLVGARGGWMAAKELRPAGKANGAPRKQLRSLPEVLQKHIESRGGHGGGFRWIGPLPDD